MKRRQFIQSGVVGGLALLFTKSFWAKSKEEVVLDDKALPTQRGVEGVLSPTNTHMVGNGFKVMNYYPNGKGFEERMSPFFLMDFNAEVNFPASDIAHGVGVHPHRGIETITFAFKGAVEHHDSKGNHGIIHPGDVQWMTAGAGVLHKEYHEQTFNRTGGAFEMLQLWLNLPKKHKMATPKYQSIVHAEKPRVVLENNMGEICIVAGEYSGVQGIASTFSPVQLWDMHLNEHADFNFQLPGNFNSGILVVDGSIIVNGKEVPENHYVQLKNEEGDIHIQAKKKCILLVLSGEPLNEPYVNYGPFVMNTEEEIRQAIQDYNAGKFGFLAD
jgi:hypothetical protein